MPISQISPSSLASNNPYVNPYAKTTETQPSATLQVNQDAQKPAKAAKTDTVTISQQALQMVAGNSSRAEESKESMAQKRIETSSGKK